MIEPTQIIEESETEVSIKWSDDTESRYTAVQLRRTCPCAGCVNEWTGDRTLDPASIPEETSFSRIALVGRYALNFVFSDGHETGIFSFDYLRRLSAAS